MPQPLDPTGTFGETPRKDSLADPLPTHPDHLAPRPLELLEEIARGGMGAILRARDADIGRDVAVKVLLEDHHGRPGSARRFLEEARIAGRLQHPGVVPVYALGWTADGRPYFAMKLIKGRTLSALLTERPDLAAERMRFLGIFEQVCQTMAYAHAHSVIHRDLKPSNVMVGAYGEVQVMDWGLAKVLTPGGARPAKVYAKLTEAVSVIQTPRVDEADSGTAGTETRAGSVLGTPAYIAPEQARGDVEDVDQRADVFGLGAILCEMLTGKPPFTGVSDAALKKARRGDLEEAFARLDDCGADAELILLAKRCLAAKPEERPADAGEAAAAVTAYQRSVAERLRRAELERTAAEARAGAERTRRRATMGLAAALLVLVLVGGGGAAWWYLERTAVTRDVEAALAEAAAHQQAGRWPDARAALERAKGRLGGAGLESLRQRLRQAKADADMVADLDEIRLRRSQTLQEKSNSARPVTAESDADAQYAKAFREYAIDVAALAAPEAAARVRQSAIRESLLSGLSDWRRTSHANGDKLLAVIEQADDNAWRQSFREALRDRDVNRMKALAADAATLTQPPAMLDWLAANLDQAGLPEEATALLQQAQLRHPEDFWINHELGETCRRVHPPKPQAAVGYLRAAVATRPESALAHSTLGMALSDSGDQAAGIAEFRRAIELDPKSNILHANLGSLLMRAGDHDGAVAEFQRVIELDPESSFARYGLGLALAAAHDREGAVTVFKFALRLDPNGYGAREELIKALAPLGRLEEARAAWGAALKFNPPNHFAWYGYAELCLYLGRDEDYRRNRRTLLKYFGDTADLVVAERTGRACLLLPDSGASLEGGAALADRAVAAGPTHGYYGFFLATKGLAEYRRGHIDAAIDALQQAGARNVWMPVTRPVLAMALHRVGRTKEAQEALAAAVESYDWDEAKADNQDAWIGHILRREAEELIVPNLAAFLKGEYQPKDNKERLELAGYSRFRMRYLSAARLYADALAADPNSADCFNAACCAARAGCGDGVDAKNLDEKERAGWRGQALTWLRAELVMLKTRVESAQPEERKQAAETLRRWRKDAALSGLRDAGDLAKLPADEQETCKKLWADVQALLDKMDAKK